MNTKGKTRVYIAAPWKSRDEMPAIAEKVEGLGLEISHKWWTVEDVPEGERSLEVLRFQAYADYTGVKTADIILLINSAKSEGKAVEQGIALGDGKTIVVVGKRGEHSSNVFHYLPSYVWVETLDEALKELQWRGDDVVSRRMGRPE